MADQSGVPGRNPARLVAFLDERLGDRFRSLVEYHPDGEQVHYLRADIDEAAAQARLERVRSLYEGERAAATPVDGDPDFGPLYASTHVFGGAVVVHILDESGSAVGFSIEPQVAGNLTDFIRECLEQLYDRDPWTRSETPE